MRRTCKAAKCPHCGAESKGWKKHIKAEFRRGYGKKFQDYQLVDYIAGAQKGLDILNEQLRVSTKDDEMQNTWAKDKIQLAGEIRLMKANQETRIQVLKDLEALGPESDEGQTLTVQLAELDNQVKQLLAQQIDREESLRALREQQSAWEQASAKLAAMSEPTEDVDAMRAEHDKLSGVRVDLSEQIGRLEARHQKHVQQMHDARRNAEALEEHGRYVAEVAVTKETVAILEALQAELVKQAFGQILERANKVTAGILRSPLDYKDGEIGRWEGSTWISHRTFSGSEKALAYSGISVALAWESPIKIILLDELSRFDADHSSELLERFRN